MRRFGMLLAVSLPLADLAWNLTNLNIGLQDFFGLAAFAHGLVENGAWPATPYFPAGYPLLLVPGGLLGNVLVWGYILSAIAATLGLLGLLRLLSVFEIEPQYQSLAITAAWLMPVWRIPAGSPSVDMLYTGLGVWFLAGAIYFWRITKGVAPVLHGAGASPGGDPRARTGPDPISAGILPASSLPPWLSFALLISPALLTFLRYHSLMLLVPVLLILLWKSSGQLRIVHHALLLVALVTAVNHVVPWFLHGEPLPSSVPLQIRSGIEFDNHIDYATPELIFQNYRQFAEDTRSMSVIDHYGPELVARHTLKGWLKFLRRPAIAFALLLVIGALLFRRKLPDGIGILAVWIPLYCLALSPAYYTPRATTLPALGAIAIIFVCAVHLAPLRRRMLAAGAISFMLFCGYAVSSNYCWLIFQERLNFSELSARWEYSQRPQLLDSGWTTMTTDDRIMCTNSRNPWAIPWVVAGGSWLLDPAIHPEQYPKVKYINFDDLNVDQLNTRLREIKTVVLYPSPTASMVSQFIEETGNWTRFQLEDGNGNSLGDEGVFYRHDLAD